MYELKTMHLFAGAGGGLLADLILGHSPVVAVEWDKYACQVLRERSADGWFPDLRVWEGDIRLFDPSEYAGTVDCIHAGFPCTDISVAGNQAGIGEGTRSGLYREILRIADVVQPQYLFLENVAAIVTGNDGEWLRTVIGDLTERGFDACWQTLSAAEVGANHKRNRWWCLVKRMGNTQHTGQFTAQISQSTTPRNDSHATGQKQTSQSARPSEQHEDVADTTRQRIQGHRPVGQQESQAHAGKEIFVGNGAGSQPGFWEVESEVGRVVDGMAYRAHMLKTLGNGQVPLQAAVAFSYLWQVMEASA